MTPKMIPKSSQNRVGIRIGFALCFSLFLAPQMEPTTPENSNITYAKQLFPQIVPFPFDHRFGTKKSPKTTPKPLQNPSKKHPENTSKINTKFHRFWAQNDPPNDARNPPKSTRGALWSHMGPKEAQKGGPGPPGDPKMDVRGPSRAPFESLLEPSLDVFQYHSRPPFDYAELCPHYYPKTTNERIRRRRRDKRTNEQADE